MHRANLSQSKVILLRDVPCQHKRECPIGMQQETTEEMAKSGGKMSKRSQSLVVEAMQIVGDPVQRTETKKKSRTVQAGGYAEVEEDEFEDRKKPKQLTKEEKIAQIFDLCGVAMLSEGRSKTLEMAHLCLAVENT